MSLRPGEVLAGCRIVSKLGEGGMGEVYRADQIELKRAVALKVLKADGENEELTRRFVREIQVHMRLSHPHLVRVFDAGCEGGLRYLVLELVEGRTLRKAIDVGPMSWEVASRGIGEILDALAYLEKSRIVHRDLKPENILVDSLGSFKLVDFGLVKHDAATVLTRANQVVGTVKYLAPEVLRGEEPGPKVDVYAAGLILHEMLTGRLPYRGASTPEWLHLILEAPIPPLRDFRHDVTEAQESFVARVLQKDPGQRPGAAEALDLLKNLDRSGPRRRSTSTRPRATGTAAAASPRPRRPIGYALPILAAIGLTAFTFVVTQLRTAPRTPEEPGLAVASPAFPSPATRRPVVGWSQVIPEVLPAGIPVIPSLRSLLTREGKRPTEHEWKLVYEHNLALDDGEWTDVWYALAVHHGRGLGVPRDLQKAKHWLKKAARGGNVFAMLAHGWDPTFYRDASGKAWTYERYEETIQRLLEEQASRGTAAAQFELGLLRQKKARWSEALAWFEKAAENGLGAACYAAARILRERISGAPDQLRADRWLAKGIKLNAPSCLRRKAQDMIEAQIERYEGRTALQLLEAGVNIGDASAAFSLGLLYTDGGVVEPDPVRAKAWFQKCLAMCEPEAFSEMPVDPALETELAKYGFERRPRPRDAVLLLNTAVDL